MQDQDHPLVVAERPHRSEQLIVGVDLAEWVVDDDGPSGAIKGHEADLAAAAEPIPADVDQDPIEPGVETRRVAQCRRRAPGQDQRILGGVLGLGLIAEDQAGQPECPIQTAVGGE